MARVLVIDDEPNLVRTIRDELLFEGFEAEAAAEGASALETAARFRPDVVLLDLMLPGINGLEVCRRLRGQMPGLWIIILTARGQEVDRVVGLEAGADDYVTKPFSLRELMARVKVGVRRAAGAPSAPRVKFGDVEIDRHARRVWKQGQEVILTRKEFDLLDVMLRRSGEIVTREQFLNEAWGENVYVTYRVIDTHILALRKKLEDDPNEPRWIQSVRGIGYRLEGMG